MKAFIALGSLIVVALLVLLIGPVFIDWTAYRTQFEAEASRLLGRKVEVRGAASARLLPFPSVTFGDVVVGDPGDPVLTIRSFRMDAELAPYLSGEIRIFDMRLDAPRLTLPIEADGSVRWPISTDTLGGGTGVVLEHIVIANGSAVLEDRRVGQNLRLTDIEASLAASSLAGPFSGTASLFANGEPLALTLTTGLATAEATLPVRLTAQSPRANLTASLDAVLSSGETHPLIEGRAELVSPSLAPPPGDTAVNDAPPPVRANARIEVAADAASLSDIRVEVGTAAQPYVAEGSAQLTLGTIPHFDLTLTGQGVDVDRLTAEDATEATFAQRVAGLRALIDRIPKPDIPGRVQVSLPIVMIGDTDLRDVSFAGSPTSDGWSIDALALDLPGRARIEASGIARLRGDPSFAGSLLLAVRQPAAFFTWAGLGDAPELVRLARAGLSAQVDLSSQTQKLDDLELDLDGAVLRGSALRTVRPEGTANAIELSGGRVDLAPLAVLLAPVRERAGRDGERYDVQFDAGPVLYGSYQAAHLSADVALANGVLDITDLNADDIAGASVHATGTIEDLFGAPRPDLSVDVVAETPDRLLSLAAELAPQSPLIAALEARSATLRPVTLAGTVASPPGDETRDLLLALSGSVGGTRTDLRLALENGLAAQSLNGRFGIDLTLENDEPAALLAQLGRPVLPIGGLAPLRITANLSGSPSTPVTVGVAMTSGDARANVDGTLVLGSEGIESARTNVALAGSDISPWLTTLGVSAAQPIEGLPADLTGSVAWSRQLLEVTDVKGSVADVPVTAALRVPAGETATGSLTAGSVSGGWLESLLIGVDDTDLDTRFGAGLLGRSPFELTVATDRVELAAGGSLRNVRARLAGDGGALRVDGLTADYGSSPLKLSASWRNVDGVVGLDVSGSLISWQLPTTGPLLGGGDLEVTASGGGRTAREILSSLNGSGRVDLVDASLTGLSPDVLAPITLAADSQTEALSADTVNQLLRETGEGAAFPLRNLSLPFRLGAGSLRLEPWTVSVPEASLSGTLGASLGDGRIDGTLVLSPTVTETVADAEPPRISYRVAGTLTEPVLDAQAEALVSYFGVRAFQREQARVEALREELAETARLRREARLYREREAIRDDLREARLQAEEAERQRLEEERRAAEEREAAAAAAAESVAPSLPTPDLSAPVLPAQRSNSPSPSALNGLPGVRTPERF